ncbi:Dynamin central region-domain-containing protein [Fomitopsis serialis]|uniref:Dynamin central region-domain-containing protein n=1 Tax=Fomitopsis serialis TaxID=139415 RepID=UPI00200771DB|nr:Dynamin central region-domain-containing protein [Neoantrodia serialis]KAH9930265.1 Dynamin central region-domain-containing protein [Neoantrodia serialis]
MDADLIKLVTSCRTPSQPRQEIGWQSVCGKSSVLETSPSYRQVFEWLVGPSASEYYRNRSIVLSGDWILSWICLSPGAPAPTYTEWGQFLHLDKRFTDFDESGGRLNRRRSEWRGRTRHQQAADHLRIYSPDVLDLTLVDLPGLTKIPVGDQPSDIERQIRSLVLDYVTKPNCIVLAVSPANVDLANSESLKLARSVDPQGRRTIGVLTKLDLMDAGTNALDILTGRVYPLKLGFIGVVGRSQQDINAGKQLSDAIDTELEFFRSHAAYRNIAHKNGTKYLAKTLNQVLLNHIRDKLPDMKARLNTLMGQAQQELNSFGDAAVYGDKNQQGALVLRLMTQFARDFVASIEGTSVDISTKELSGGARIYYIFNDVFGSALNSIDSTHNLDNQDIRTAIRNSTGPRPSLFVPEIAFDLLVKPQIKLLESPSLRCVELVYEELVKICHNCTSAELQRFPRLHAQLVEVISELLRERLGPTTDYTQSLIDIQTAYINTNHPAFIAGSAMATQAPAMAPPKHEFRRPSSAQSVNGPVSPDEDEDTSEETNGMNGVALRDGRSVSSTVHDRARTIASVNDAGTSPRRTGSPKPHNQHGTVRPHSAHPAGGAAKETFLNYFFGQNGPGPISGATAERAASGTGATTIGRDVSGGDPSLHSGLMAGKRSLEGNNAAFDMKSLGKHIEAASDKGPQLTPREEMETNLIRSLIASYFNIVRQTIQDLVPKAIMHFLVNNTSQQVQNRLVASLYKPDLFGELLNEDETLVAERTRVKALLDAYKDAFKTLSEVTLKSS